MGGNIDTSGERGWAMHTFGCGEVHITTCMEIPNSPVAATTIDTAEIYRGA